MRRKSFTLVELIITIAIIAILAVTAFLVITKWISKSRDSGRLQDLSVIQQGLETEIINTKMYPMPDNSFTVMDTGNAIAWYQGEFTENVKPTVQSLSKTPKDPQGNYYGYSLSNDKKQYQLRAYLENVAYNDYKNKTYADTQITRIKGNYNGFLVTATGGKYYLWNVPTLFLWTGTGISSGSNYLSEDKKPADNTRNIVSADVSGLYDADTSNNGTTLDNIVSVFSGTDGVSSQSLAQLTMKTAVGGVNVGNATDDAPHILSVWRTKSNMNIGRETPGIGVTNGKIYAIGGATTTVEEYDPNTNTWTYKANLPTARYGFGVGVVNGKIYAIGGYDGSSTYYNKVEEYDPSTNTWSTKANMPTARAYLSIGTVNGKLYAIGGHNGGNLTTVEEYDPSTNTWTIKLGMSIARHRPVVGVIDNKIYVAGGMNGVTVLSSMECYDPSTDTWTNKSSMSVARRGFAGGVANGKLYAVGGYNGLILLSSVEQYDPSTNAWIITTPMSLARRTLGVGFLNNKIYAIGGRDTSSNLLTLVEEFGW